MNEENSIDLGQLFYVISKRKKIILTITLVTLLISIVLTFFIMSPVYESKATVIVGKANSSTSSTDVQYNDVMMYQNLTKTYTSIATSNYIEGIASDSIGNGMTTDKLAKLIKVTPEDGTQILDITADASNPRDAMNYANAEANSLVNNAKNVYNAGDIRIMDKGELTQKPVKPNKIINIAISLLLGLFISIGISFALEFMDNTVKTQDDIKRYLDLPLLGTIPMQDEL